MSSLATKYCSERTVKHWNELKSLLTQLESNWAFRGQRDSGWGLETSLERAWRGPGRDVAEKTAIAAYRRKAPGLRGNLSIKMSTPHALVQKLWNYCNTLRDDGMSYGVAKVERRFSMVEELEAVVTAALPDVSRCLRNGIWVGAVQSCSTPCKLLEKHWQIISAQVSWFVSRYFQIYVERFVLIYPERSSSHRVRTSAHKMNRARHHPEKDTLRRHGVDFQVGQAHAQYAHIVCMASTQNVTKCDKVIPATK